MDSSPRPDLADRHPSKQPDASAGGAGPPRRSASSGDGRRDGAGAWRRAWLFALNFLKHPLSVGTFLQSSPALVRRLLDGVDWSRPRTVVELGPGVGTISGALLGRLRADARLLLVERNADFVRALRADLSDPRVRVIHGSAQELGGLLAEQGSARVDLVISGIPFSTLRREARMRVLEAVRAALHPEGQLLVYQHTSQALPLLRRYFRTVRREIEWRNLLPMRLFRCSEPRQEVPAPPA